MKNVNVIATGMAFETFNKQLKDFIEYCEAKSGTKDFPVEQVCDLAVKCDIAKISLNRAIQNHSVKLSKPVLHDSHVCLREKELRDIQEMQKIDGQMIGGF